MPHRVADSPFPQERTRQQAEIDFEHAAMAPARPRLPGGGETPGEALTGTPTPTASRTVVGEHGELQSNGDVIVYQDFSDGSSTEIRRESFAENQGFATRGVGPAGNPPLADLHPDRQPILTNVQAGGSVSTARMRQELAQHDSAWLTASDAAVIREWTRLTSAEGDPRATQGGVPGEFAVAPLDAIDTDTRRMYQEYLETRLRDLELPEMQNLDRRQRIQLAFEAALAFGDQSGYTTDPSSFAAFVGIELPGDFEFLAGMPTLDRQRFEEATRQFNVQATGYIDGQPTFEREQYATNLLANPRTLVEGLLALGMSQEEASGVVSQSPLYRSITGPYFGQLEDQPTQQQLMWPDATRGLGGIGAQVLTPVNMNDPAEVQRYQQQYGGTQQDGRVTTPVTESQYPTGSSGFQFIRGRQLPVRQTLTDVQTGSSRIPLYSSLAALSGQNREEFFGDFEQALPQGEVAPLTSVR